MLKSIRQAIKLLKMKWTNDQLKTLKVSPDLHYSLKRLAAEGGYELTPYVAAVLAAGMLNPQVVQTLLDQQGVVCTNPASAAATG